MKNFIALIGFGEAGSSFALAAAWGKLARGWDVSPVRRALMPSVGIIEGASLDATVAEASLILSVVTADQSLKAAELAAPFISSGAIWCDMNSVAPDTKRATSSIIQSAGGRYVDVAIMAPVNPQRLAVPILLAGADAPAAESALRLAGFQNIRTVGSEVGRASAIKMIRSVMVKGLEALTDEMMAAANAAGVADEVIASLDASEKTISWRDRVEYNLERMATHGARRAAEMEESAKTLQSLCVEPVMTEGTVWRQRKAALKGEQL